MRTDRNQRGQIGQQGPSGQNGQNTSAGLRLLIEHQLGKVSHHTPAHVGRELVFIGVSANETSVVANALRGLAHDLPEAALVPIVDAPLGRWGQRGAREALAPLARARASGVIPTTLLYDDDARASDPNARRALRVYRRDLLGRTLGGLLVAGERHSANRSGAEVFSELGAHPFVGLASASVPLPSGDPLPWYDPGRFAGKGERGYGDVGQTTRRVCDLAERVLAGEEGALLSTPVRPYSRPLYLQVIVPFPLGAAFAEVADNVESWAQTAAPDARLGVVPGPGVLDPRSLTVGGYWGQVSVLYGISAEELGLELDGENTDESDEDDETNAAAGTHRAPTKLPIRRRRSTLPERLRKVEPDAFTESCADGRWNLWNDGNDENEEPQWT